MSTDQEFLETIATVLATIKEMAYELGVDDRLVLSCFVGLINLEEDEEENKLNAVYDHVFDSDDEFEEIMDFMIEAWERDKEDPPEGTVDWWLDRIN
jgi:hypothetical protein